jgi:hypothetical protein
MPAANIDEAIADVVTNVIIKAPVMATALSLWLVIFGPTISNPFDENKPGQRTVRDWQVPTRRAFGEIPDTGVSPDWLTEEIISIVNATLEAVRAANAAGRISQAQEDDTVAQYNIAWP